ncbi:8642_t:CDS:1, partial [Racocetra persica]
QISENKKPRTFVDLGDIIETIKIILNNTLVDYVDYLKFYKEQQYIDMDINNFSNIKIKIIDNS